MNRRNFFRFLGGAAVAVAVAPFVAEAPKLLSGQLGSYEGIRIYEPWHHVSVKGTWRGPKANLHSLPRYGGALKENLVQSQVRDLMSKGAKWDHPHRLWSSR